MLGITALVSFYGIASLAVWFLGPSIGLDYVWQIVIIALLLITLPFVLLLNYWRKRRAAKREAAQAQVSEAPQQAVYGLPWFVVAGPPSSGKTSLVLSSGLDLHALPSQRRTELNIVRPTRHCEWRMTGSAVLLDTSGRYQNDGPVREEWIALAETIKKYRLYRPLDNLILTVDADRIFRASDSEIEQQAKTLRARLDELMQRVRTRFPVYLVFTHVDAIEGFKDFFSPAREDWRSEVFGGGVFISRRMSETARLPFLE